MQIHEITQIREGILKTIGSDIAGAVTSPFKKLGAILDQPEGLTSPTAAGAGMDQYYRGQIAKNQGTTAKVTQQATTQWAQKLASEWEQTAKSIPSSTGASPGQMSSELAASKTGQDMEKMFGPARGKIEDMQSDIEEATQEPTVTLETYKQSFLKWVDKKTTTRIPGTNINLTVDAAHRENGPVLDPALDAVLKTRDNPGTNQQAVQNYLLQLARVMQKMSAETKAKNGQNRPSANSGSPLLSYLIPSSTIEQIRTMAAEDPVKKIQLRKELGLN